MEVVTVTSNMGTVEKPAMADDDYRAILTEREKEIISREADVSEKYRYRVITRVRDKIGKLPSDLELLDEHHDTLGDELRQAVCDSEQEADDARE